MSVAPPLRDRFAEDGFVLVPSHLPKVQVEELDRHLARARTRFLAERGEAATTESLSARDLLRRDAEVARSVAAANLEGLARELLGGPVRYVNDRLFVHEQGRTDPTPWHQDSPLTEQPHERLAVLWLLTQGERVAPLRFGRRSHTSGQLYLDRRLQSYAHRLPAPPLVVSDDTADELLDVATPASAVGDVLAFDGMTAHASRPEAAGTGRRVALSVRYATA